MNTPITGVTYLTYAPEWIHDEFYNAINLDFEEFESGLLAQLESGEITEDEFEYERDTFENGTTFLLGDWLQDENNLYYPDPNGEYAAIYNNNDNYIQVVFSQATKKCKLCSPCFPGQGDLESEGKYLTYCLPE